MLWDMATADSSMAMAMAFLQGHGQSSYNHHMLSFQSNPIPGPPPASASTSTTSHATLFHPPDPTSSSSLHGASKYKFVTGSPADWTPHDLTILKDGLIRYAHEPNIVKYIKIAAMLPTRTVRDVALRCWWTPGKESSSRKPGEYYAGKNMTYVKDTLAASTSIAHIQMSPSNNAVPFPISMQHPSRHGLVPREVPSLDSATQNLLEKNNQLLSQIAVNIETSKTQVNMGLFLRVNNNVRAILKRMSETPGVMGQMPPLPVPINDGLVNSLIQWDGGVRPQPCD